jgi:glycosyltransferase involved in cell wall biosynthesis
MEEIREKLLTICDETIVLPSQYARSACTRVWHRLNGGLYGLRTGLKFSNYLVGRLEFTPERMASMIPSVPYDCVLFEYWHAVESVPVFRRKGTPCVLDMHNILWQTYTRQLNAKPWVPEWWKRHSIAQYRRREEQAWRQFDALIAINTEEYAHARAAVPEGVPVFYAPMGTDLELWPFSWEPMSPARVGYYGGLGSPHNQRDAWVCYQEIMPRIWQDHPDTELWLVGSNPPEALRSITERDRRVRVTGYVDNVQEVLRRMSLVLCPWSGTYGFRSRLVEVMALGVPTVASPEAVYGMGMTSGQGIFLEKEPEQMARVCLGLLRHPELAGKQSHLARAQVEEKYSYEATYGRLAEDLAELTVRREKAQNDTL